MTTVSTKRRRITFKDESELIADLEGLRKGWESSGRWTLEQACWHLEFPISHSLHDAAGKEPTAFQKRVQTYLEQVVADGWPDSTKEAPKEMAPPADASPESIDRLIDSLRSMQGWKSPTVDAFLFGPVETKKFRRFVLIHAAHHLSFFESTKG